MALTQTLAQMRANVQSLADIGGTAALVRHPTASLNDYLNRGIGALYRILTLAVPDQRYLSTTTITTSTGTTTYSLPADFDHLVSADLTAYGAKVWLQDFAMEERATLTSPNGGYSGVPFSYRLRGANIELLPSPTAAFTLALWYVPSFTQLASDSDALDTINRLDEFVVAYAARLVGIRDKNWDLVNACKQMMDELRGDIETIGRSRDKNSPSRIVDESMTNRWGRRAGLPRRWR